MLLDNLLISDMEGNNKFNPIDEDEAEFFLGIVKDYESFLNDKYVLLRTHIPFYKSDSLIFLQGLLEQVRDRLNKVQGESDLINIWYKENNFPKPDSAAYLKIKEQEKEANTRLSKVINDYLSELDGYTVGGKPETDENTKEKKTKKDTANKIKVTKDEAFALCEKLLNSNYEMSIEEKEKVKTNNFKSARTSFMKRKKMYNNFPSILNELEKQMFIAADKMKTILNAPSDYYRSVLIESFRQSCHMKGRFDDKYYNKVGGKNLKIKEGKQGKEIGYKLIPKD